jgi:hypothetical protein
MTGVSRARSNCDPAPHPASDSVPRGAPPGGRYLARAMISVIGIVSVGEIRTGSSIGW